MRAASAVKAPTTLAVLVTTREALGRLCTSDCGTHSFFPLVRLPVLQMAFTSRFFSAETEPLNVSIAAAAADTTAEDAMEAVAAHYGSVNVGSNVPKLLFFHTPPASGEKQGGGVSFGHSLTSASGDNLHARVDPRFSAAVGEFYGTCQFIWGA